MHMNRKEQLFRGLISLSNELFSDRDHFICVYGSYASDHYTPLSDIDVFIATESYNEQEFARARDVVCDLHRQFGLPLDDEVPYENKLVVSYSDLIDAVALRAFTREDARYVIPPIRKDREFLASPEVRLRLIFNALTSPHVCIAGNHEHYRQTKAEAEYALFTLAHGLTAKQGASTQELLESLLRGPGGEEGELYLGYKRERPTVISYVHDLIVHNHKTRA